MRNLIEFLTRYNHWLVFALLEIFSLVLLFQYNNYQNSVWFSSANAVSGRLLAWDNDVQAFFSLSKVNRELTQRNIQLEQQVKQLSVQLSKVANDSGRTVHGELARLQQYRLIPASVVGNSINKTDNLITIDKGEADGVHPDMGVVSGTGVVGIVYLTSAHYAVVIPVINTQSSISCTIRRRGYLGYLHWTGGNTKTAYVEDVPRHARFALYDWVETSGYSSVFPPGITVGRIRHVYNSADGLSYRLKVILSTDFSNLRDVCVIDNTAMKERIQLMEAAEDSIKVKEEEN